MTLYIMQFSHTHTHTGSPQIEPEFWSDENTPSQLATNHRARVLNLTDEQILWEYNNIGGSKRSSSVLAISGGIVSVLLSITVLGGAIAGLAFGYKWYIKLCGLVMHMYTHIT